jgi:hypothetical protein
LSINNTLNKLGHIPSIVSDYISSRGEVYIRHIEGTVRDYLSNDKDLSVKHIEGIVQDHLTSDKDLSVKHIEGIVQDHLTSDKDLSVKHIEGIVRDYLSNDKDLSVKHIEGIVRDYLSNDKDLSVKHIEGIVRSHLTSDKDLSARHIEDIVRSHLTSDKDLSVKYLTDIIRGAINQTRDLDATIHTTDIIRGAINQTRDLDATIHTTDIIRGAINQTRDLDKAVYTVDVIRGSLSQTRDLDKAVYTVDVIRGALSQTRDLDKAVYTVDVIRGALSQTRDLDKITYNVDLAYEGLKLEKYISAIKTRQRWASSIGYNISPSILSKKSSSFQYMFKEIAASIRYSEIYRNKLLRDTNLLIDHSPSHNTFIHIDIDPAIDHRPSTMHSAINRSMDFTGIETDEWHYLFDSTQYDWSLSRIKTHSDNPDIKKYCYPEYTVYLILDMTSFNILVADASGNITYDVDERNRAIETIKNEMTTVTYQSIAEIDVTPLLSSLKCIKVTSTYRQPHYRDEAFTWFENQFNDPNSILRTATNYISTADIASNITQACAIESAVGDLYEKFAPDPGTITYPPHVAPCISPTDAITALYTGVEMTLDCQSAPVIIHIDAPLLSFTDAFFIGEDPNNPGTFIWDLDFNPQPLTLVSPNHTITIRGFDFNITYTGSNPHRFKVDFPPALLTGDRYDLCGDKYVICGDKFIVCGDKFVVCI